VSQPYSLVRNAVTKEGLSVDRKLGQQCHFSVTVLWLLFAARYYASAAYVVMRCLSVRSSVTFVSCVKTSKHIIKIFHRPVATPF